MRGASRYHYCGIKATNEITKEIVEYYNGFEAGTGKSIICEYDGNSTGSTNGAGVEFCGAYGHEEEQEESYGQDGLVAHMGGLHGLGGDEHVSSSYQTSSVQDLNELGSITLYRPGMFNQQHQHQMHPQQQLRHGMKLERSDSTFSSPIDVMNRRPSTSSSYSDVSHHPSVSAFAPLDSSASLDGPAMLLNGPFAGGNIVPTPPGQQHQQLRRQLSAPTSLREQMIQDSNDINMSQQQQQQYQDMPEISFGDLKTPTAFHFMQQGNAATHAQMQKVIYSSGASASSITSIHSTGIQHSFVKDLNSNSLLAVPRAHRLTPDSQGGGTPGDGTPTPCNGLEQASEGQKSLAAAKASPQLLGQTSSAAMSAGRSASIPNTSTHPSAIDTFALRFKGRRATLPDLHIRIPPSSRNPPSASSNLSKGSSAAGKSISEEKEANMNTTDADADGEGEEDEDEDEDDQMYEDKKTARLIPRSDYQENQQASLPMLDIPLPSFQEIIQAFSARLVGSPNHPGGVLARQLSANSRESSSSGSASRNVDNTTFSANDVIAARNASMAVLKNLDMGHAEAVWELYRTSHCRGLLRLAQQGKLDEVSSSVTL